MARILTKQEHENLRKDQGLGAQINGKVLSGVRLETGANGDAHATLTLRIQVDKPAGWIVDRLASDPHIGIILPPLF